MEAEWESFESEVLRDITDSQFAFQVTLERIEVRTCRFRFTYYVSKEITKAVDLRRNQMRHLMVVFTSLQCSSLSGQLRTHGYARPDARVSLVL